MSDSGLQFVFEEFYFFTKLQSISTVTSSAGRHLAKGKLEFAVKARKTFDSNDDQYLYHVSSVFSTKNATYFDILLQINNLIYGQTMQEDLFYTLHLYGYAWCK